MTTIAIPSPDEPDVVLLGNPRCPGCGAKGRIFFPAIVRVHGSQPHRRRGKSISKKASWAASFPFQCRSCHRRLGGLQLLEGRPLRFRLTEPREDDLCGSVVQ